MMFTPEKIIRRLVGTYNANDGTRLFTQIVSKLRDWDFYAMRLRESPVIYLDGHSDAVAVMRCGVVTIVGTLGTMGLPFEADLHDSKTDDFIKFVDAL